jgi:pilus assembly protein Flp/PilA
MKMTEIFMRSIATFLADESGSNAAEYALIIALVAGVIVVAATALGTAISGKLTSIGTTISTAA